MALPPSLRTSITPPELELVASEQLVEIVPLVSMERTAFISVSHILQLYSTGMFAKRKFYGAVGRIRSSQTTNKVQSTALDGVQSEAQKEMPHNTTNMAECW